MEENVVAIHWDLVFWTAVNFLVFFLLLHRFGWKAIQETFRRRQETISRNLSQAEDAREEALRLRQQYEQELAQMRARAEEVLAQANQWAAELSQELTSQARQQADEILRRAREEIAHEREAAVAALREEVADLALRVAGRVLEREIADADRERLARQFVEEVGGLR